MTRSQDIEQWEVQLAPTLQTLMATLGAASRAARNGPSSLLAASDQLSAASRDARVWLASQSCPLPDIEDRLVRTMRSFRILTRLMQIEASSAAGPNLKAIDQEIEDLVGMIANTVAVLSDHTDS